MSLITDPTQMAVELTIEKQQLQPVSTDVMSKHHPARVISTGTPMFE